MNPKFIIYTGPMFGSKTTRLMAEIDRATYRKRKILAFKSQKDKRYIEDKISTHSGATYPAICIEDALSIFHYLDDNSYNSNTIIAVDEAFMIKNIDSFLISLYRKGINIIISTIQLDANETPFENIKNMMPWATKIEICPAVCTMCDQDAYFTEAMFDINNSSVEERVGSYGMYEPRCTKHYTTFKE
jgi:thymidine kinase